MNAKLLLLLSSLLPVAAQASEYPLFEPFPRSVLDDHKVKEFDEYDLPTGTLDSGRHIKVASLEGRFVHMDYHNPPERSTLELMRNYETALKESGLQTIYSCKGRQCGSGCIQDKGLGWHCVGEDDRYLVGKIVKEGGAEVYLGVLVLPNNTRVAVVEAKAMEQSIAGAKPSDEAVAAVKRPAARAAEEDEAPAVPTPGASKEVTSGIIKGLSQLGMQARIGAASGADILVEGTTETRPVDNPDKRWKFARSTASITLKDGQNGRAFLSFEASDRQASGDFKEAARRSRVELAKKVADQVHSAITEYFENQ